MKLACTFGQQVSSALSLSSHTDVRLPTSSAALSPGGWHTKVGLLTDRALDLNISWGRFLFSDSYKTSLSWRAAPAVWKGREEQDRMPRLPGLPPRTAPLHSLPVAASSGSPEREQVPAGR